MTNEPQTWIPKPPAPDETLVFLVRHAQSTFNTEHRLQGQMEGVELSDHGMEQAEALADWFGSLGLSRVHLYSSDLERARQTAEAIGRCFHAPVQSVAALREMHGGKWQGLTRAEIDERFPGQAEARHNSFASYTLHEGESGEAVLERLQSFYKEALQRHPGDTLIIVSHGAALATLQAGIHNWDLDRSWVEERGRLRNTGVTALRYSHAARKHKIELADSVEHLDRISEVQFVPDNG